MDAVPPNVLASATRGQGRINDHLASGQDARAPPGPTGEHDHTLLVVAGCVPRGMIERLLKLSLVEGRSP